MSTKVNHFPEASIFLDENKKPCAKEKSAWRIKLTLAGEGTYTCKLMKKSNCVAGFQKVHEEIYNRQCDSPSLIFDDYEAKFDEKNALEALLTQAFPVTPSRMKKIPCPLNPDGSIKKSGAVRLVGKQ
ncbi:hypothetical protein FAI40_10135 [Acetobacteraceae bacterium]|nr:hypothetical protein FAI40_10135 [Acetobacteraceae bacterium]